MIIANLIQGRDVPIVTCAAEALVGEAASQLAQNRIGAMPVMEGESVAGIFSERDVLYCIAKEGAATLNKPVRDVMTAPAISVDPASTVDEALSLMTKRRIRHLPVLKSGQLLAFISIGDLVKSKIEEAEAEAREMREYIRMA
ncbi:CBS domain-containing protein [Altericroceibacterium endophyticum]|uniref:CBS domain-containing protein n=1 Tax=Altericroceibacterium endophyticum TaxID=1808508 RepID=A0A6I4T401_9SPHN|nr:CBS domain-containing protein [Altericroceibacterium endophyticum]MXO65637.1 CBS domain-containing protein [Altericroceibacterium endophyticum]